MFFKRQFTDALTNCFYNHKSYSNARACVAPRISLILKYDTFFMNWSLLRTGLTSNYVYYSIDNINNKCNTTTSCNNSIGNAIATSTNNITSELVTLCKNNEISGITILSLNDSERLNALGIGIIAQLRQALEEIRKDLSCRVLIIRSTLLKIFCVGADLKERMKMSDSEIASFVHLLRETFSQVYALPIPSIAAINGSALGGGLELALATDYRICSTSDSLKLGLPECTLGIIPGAGGTQRLARLIGISNSKRLIFGGERISSLESLRIGLVDELHEDPYERALELATKWTSSAPIALRMAKLAINGGIDLPLASGMALEEMCYAQVIPTEDRKEALRAFIEKRAPKFIGK